jgi:hypothetical protein
MFFLSFVSRDSACLLLELFDLLLKCCWGWLQVFDEYGIGTLAATPIPNLVKALELKVSNSQHFP